jgi:type IX secretion system PorP/SprF family membrane protein
MVKKLVTMKKLIIIFSLFTALNGMAQQDALFSQYMFNKLTVNPAYAGSREVFSADLISRYQWVGFDGAPKTLSLSMHSPLKNEHMALGCYVYSDNIGATLDQGAQAVYAYRIILPKGKLSFGISAGMKYYNIDFSKVNVEDPDYFFYGIQEKKRVADANFGVYYYNNHFYTGISSKQLLQNEYAIVNTSKGTSYSRLARHFYGMAGLAIPVSDKVIFRPSTLVKFVKNAPWQIDLNASFLINDVLWLGATYRTDNTLAGMAELLVGKSLRIGYSYDYNLSPLRNFNSGSHEIRLGVDFDLLRIRMLTPRYF